MDVNEIETGKEVEIDAGTTNSSSARWPDVFRPPSWSLSSSMQPCERIPWALPSLSLNGVGINSGGRGCTFSWSCHSNTQEWSSLRSRNFATRVLFCGWMILDLMNRNLTFFYLDLSGMGPHILWGLALQLTDAALNAGEYSPRERIAKVSLNPPLHIDSVHSPSFILSIHSLQRSTTPCWSMWKRGIPRSCWRMLPTRPLCNHSNLCKCTLHDRTCSRNCEQYI